LVKWLYTPQIHRPKFTNLQSQISSADRQLRHFFPILRIRENAITFDVFRNPHFRRYIGGIESTFPPLYHPQSSVERRS
jgi:hypothetical protein